MKIFLPFALVAAALAIAPAAHAAETHSFTHDGIRFDVKETYRGGVRFLEGKDSTGANFLVRVRGSKVTGTYRGSPIAFTIPAPAATPEKVASR